MQFLRGFILAAALQLAGSGLAPVASWGAVGLRPGPAQPLASVSGRVMNNKGAPLPSVVVTVKGSAKSTTTNSAGIFLLALEIPAPVLVFTCLGYQPQAVPVPTQGNLAVTLYPIGVAAPFEVSGAPAEAADPAAGPATLLHADVLPVFPGGETAYLAYLRQNSHYPDKAREAGLAGTVFVSFVVDEVGRILDVQVLKGCGNGFDEEAVRLMRLMPWWTPGRQAGKPARVATTLRIRFGVQPD